MKKIEAVGKNVEKAIESGLQELNVTRDKVSIEIVDAGGLFKKAKVILTLDDEQKETNLADFKQVSTATLLDEIETSETNESIENIARDDDKQVLEGEEEQVNNLEDTISDQKNVDLEDNGLSVGANKVKTFLDGYLKCVGVDAMVDISENEDAIKVDIVGLDAGKIIGKHGDGLNAIQYLCNIVANKADRECGKVFIDSCGYKEQREQELIKLARKLKFSALREEKPVKLEPMSAYDRKIIHKALHDDDSVETHSEGEEPKRYVVITLKDKNENEGQ